MAKRKKVSTTKSTAKKTARKSRKTAKKSAPNAKTPSRSMPDKVSVEISLCAPTGSGILTSFSSNVRPRAENVSRFHADALHMERALGELRKLGFEIVAVSRTSISVECQPRLFSDTFGTKLAPQSFTAPAAATPSAKSYLGPAPDATWLPPSPLEGLIERAYIQKPYIYFESPIPPQVDYHHLCVPGDLALLTNSAKVHREGITGKGVKVAMIDSGFYTQHPYYRGMGYNMSRMLAPGATDLEKDEVGHGSAEMANILAIAPDVKFIGVKSGPSLAAAFKVTVQQSPDIISVSLGFDLRSDLTGLPLTTLPGFLNALETDVADAVAAGITVVFSAGNGHISFPGMHPDVVSAGGAFIAKDDAIQASDYGSAFKSSIYPGRNVPDICGLVGMKPNADYIMLPLQPGCNIDRDGSASDETAPKDGWAVISGTSAAAPQLAGVCALLKQQNPGLSPADIKAVLKLTSRDVEKGHANEVSNPVSVGGGIQFEKIFATSGPDVATGNGLVDAHAAWKQV